MKFMNKPCTSQELIADYVFGGIADKRNLIKDEAHEPLGEIFEHKADEARDCESDRLQHHAAGSAVLWNPPVPSGRAGTRPAGKLQWSDQLGKLISARDRQKRSYIVNVYQALGGGWDYLSGKDPAVAASPHVAAAARGPANPDPQPVEPRTSQSGSADDLPPTLP
jgi:hypothetical protein